MVKTDISDYWRHTWCGDKELPQDNAANGKSRLYGGDGEAAVVWAGDKVVYAKQRENLAGVPYESSDANLILTNGTTCAYEFKFNNADKSLRLPLKSNIYENDDYTISFDVSDYSCATGSKVGFYVYTFAGSLSHPFYFDSVGHKAFTIKSEKSFTSGGNLALQMRSWIGCNAGDYCIVKNIKLEKNIVDTLYSVAPSVTDNRVKIGKHYYHTTQIGNLIWTAENLNEDLGGGTWEGYYNNDPTYGVKGYGKLYTWDAICKANETPSDTLAAILPEGWRVPTKADFDALIASVGSSNVAKLKEKWYCTTAGKNDTGFSALNCGDYITSGSFENVGTNDFIWCATQKTESISNYLLVSGSAGVYTQYKNTYAFSIRLVRDAETATALLEE